MGALESRQETLFQQYKFMQKRNSSLFGEISIMQDTKTNQIFAIREQLFQTEFEFTKEESSLSKKSTLFHPNLLQLKKPTFINEKQLCSNIFKLFNVFEYLPLDLLQIQKSLKNSDDIIQSEVLNMLVDISSALSFLQSKGITHGDIRCDCIFIEKKDRNTYKIAEIGLIKRLSGYLSLLTGIPCDGIYLSPKLLDGLKNKTWRMSHNIWKSDVFTLGCLALEMALGRSMKELYDFEKFELKQDKLNSIWEEIKNDFSEEIIKIFKLMLQIDENKRPDLIEINKILTCFHLPSTNQSSILKPTNKLNLNISQNFKDKEILPRARITIQNKENEFVFQAFPKEKSSKMTTMITENKEIIKNEADPMVPDQESLSVVFPTVKKFEKTPNIDRQNDGNPSTKNLQLADSIKTNQKQNESYISEEVQAILKEYMQKNQESTEKTNNITEKTCDFNEILSKKTYDYNENQTNTFLTKSKLDESSTFQIPTEKLCEKTESINTKTAIFKDQQSLAELNENSEDLITNIKQVIKEAKKSTISDLPSLSSKIFVYETYDDGSIYHGEKQGNFRNGRGRFYYADGGMYDGEWLENHIDGFGILYYPNGCIAYQGDWKIDKFHGKGIVYNEIPIVNNEFDGKNFDYLNEGWAKYEGEFDEDNKQGKGVLTLANGDVFVGEFENDLVSGNGCFFKVRGEMIEGIWRNNVFDE